MDDELYLDVKRIVARVFELDSDDIGLTDDYYAAFATPFHVALLQRSTCRCHVAM